MSKERAFLGQEIGWWVERRGELQIKGQENIPTSGPFLVTTTHELAPWKVGPWDVPRPPLDISVVSLIVEETTKQPVVWIAADRSSVACNLPPPLQFLARKVWSWGLERYGALCVPLNQDPKSRIRAVKEAISLLKRGQIIGIALTPGEKLEKKTIRQGAAFIALKASKTTGPLPVLLVKITGLEAPWQVIAKHPIEVSIHKPVLVQFNPSRPMREQRREWTKRFLSLLKENS